MTTNGKRIHTMTILRWAVLPLLFYLLGQYLEGPPTRVVVRSVPFIFTCIAISILAVQFLRQRHNIPLGTVLLAGVVTPLGFIISLQNYYNGGKNPDYAVIAGVFSVLMLLNGGIYLYSLFPRRNRTENNNLNTKPGDIKSYKIKLHSVDNHNNIVGLKYQDAGESILPQYISIDGYSQDQAISLRVHWEEIQQNQIEHYIASETIRETIVKFGETMQLVDHYQLEIDVSFE